MGEAKRRGTYEQRCMEARARNLQNLEEEQKRLALQQQQRLDLRKALAARLEAQMTPMKDKLESTVVNTGDVIPMEGEVIIDESTTLHADSAGVIQSGFNISQTELDDSLQGGISPSQLVGPGPVVIESDTVALEPIVEEKIINNI